MNGELEVLQINSVIFPLKPHEKEVSEVKSIKIEEAGVTKIHPYKLKNRFARLKKSIRKRSKNIL